MKLKMSKKIWILWYTLNLWQYSFKKNIDILHIWLTFSTFLIIPFYLLIKSFYNHFMLSDSQIWLKQLLKHKIGLSPFISHKSTHCPSAPIAEFHRIPPCASIACRASNPSAAAVRCPVSRFFAPESHRATFARERNQTNQPPPPPPHYPLSLRLRSATFSRWLSVFLSNTSSSLFRPVHTRTTFSPLKWTGLEYGVFGGALLIVPFCGSGGSAHSRDLCCFDLLLGGLCWD